MSEKTKDQEPVIDGKKYHEVLVCQLTDQEPVIEGKKHRDFLLCQLTDQELQAAAQDLAKLIDDHHALEDDLAALRAQFKAKIEQCGADINTKARLVRDRCEVRLVDVEVRYDYTACTVTTVRLDTNEAKTRNMTGDEKQLQINYDAG